MQSLLAIVALVAFPGLLPACSCDRTTVEQTFDATELVFRGRVISESDRGGAFGRRVVFQVAKVYKGAPGGTVEMMGIAGGSDCMGFTTGAPKVGQDLIVYANFGYWRSSNGKEWVVSQCSRPGLLPRAAPDIPILDSLAIRLGKRIPK